jgi:hypothetical protein
VIRILAIDPGTTASGWCVWDGTQVVAHGVADNHDVRHMVKANEHGAALLALEMVASYGMAVGAEVFRTVWWTGRFAEAWIDSGRREPREVFRKEVKLHHCLNARAKDANVRQALIDRLGPKGTKKQPGPTYGISSHVWPALAVALLVADGMGATA